MRSSKEIYIEYEKEVDLSAVSLSKLLGCSVDDPNLGLFINHLLRSVHLQSEYSRSKKCEFGETSAFDNCPSDVKLKKKV